MKLDWKQVKEGQWEAHAKGRRVSFGARVVTADRSSSRFYQRLTTQGLCQVGVSLAMTQGLSFPS